VIIGFTGTRQGMSWLQKQFLRLTLQNICEIGKVNEFHHGGCVGADAEAHQIVRQIVPFTIHVHWPENRKYEARLSGPFVSEGRKPYLVRNEDIVKACDLLIAAPLTDKEQLRSGTWATIRCARRLGKECLILTREQS